GPTAAPRGGRGRARTRPADDDIAEGDLRRARECGRPAVGPSYRRCVGDSPRPVVGLRLNVQPACAPPAVSANAATLTRRPERLRRKYRCPGRPERRGWRACRGRTDELRAAVWSHPPTAQDSTP